MAPQMATHPGLGRLGVPDAWSTRLGWPLRILVGLPLLLMTGSSLFITDLAHVAICMVGGVVLAAGLLTPHPTWSRRLASAGGAWVAFYTVYTATTFLAIENWGSSSGVLERAGVGTTAAWGYHTAINFVLLMVFALRLDDLRWAWGGLTAAMLAAPAMLLMTMGPWERWAIESPPMIVGYAVLGLFTLSMGLRAADRGGLTQLLERARPLAVASILLYVPVTILYWIDRAMA